MPFVVIIYAGVAKWQTRWTQNPVGPKPVWVRVPPSALSFLGYKKTNAYALVFLFYIDLLNVRNGLLGIS